MSESQQSAEIEIRLRHLDHDEESRSMVTGRFSSSPGERRVELTRLVTAEHEGARLKSFDGLVASFVTGTHLIVASFVDPEQLHVERAADVPADQVSLFADGT
ncbi:MAG: hypothetical protein EXQ70_02730 [Solirubrobacterales bacterium]|nr:hypothetical protein [Solirubrobacterales bacterium]